MSVLPLAEPQPAEHAARRRAAASEGAKPDLKALPTVRRRQKGLIVGVLMLLITALAAVLATNIYVANSQYDVVQMTNEHRDLVHQNQALSQQVQFLESPQSLSNSAVSLGMVMPAPAGTIDLSTGDIVSGAEVASSSEVPSSFVSAPSSLQPELSAGDVAEHAETSASGLLGTGALHTLSQPSAGENSPGTATGGTSPGTDLHGGTIPAPKLTD